jgi:hypothetical protein
MTKNTDPNPPEECPFHGGPEERPGSDYKLFNKGKGLAGGMTIAERLAVELRRPGKAGERVIVKHVGGPSFRVNWFLPVVDTTTGKLAVAQWKIDQSRFLHVTEDGRKLVVVDKTLTKS